MSDKKLTIVGTYFKLQVYLNMHLHYKVNKDDY